MAVLLTTALLAGAAVSAPLPPTSPAPREESIRIVHRFHGKPLEFHKPGLKLASGAKLEITRVEYLVSNVRLQREDGTWVDFPDQYFHLNPMDHKDSITLKNVPAGKFQALAMTVGLDEKTNHGDPAQWPGGHALNVLESNLQWGWKGGYVFLAVEGRAKQGKAKPETFLYHIGNDANRMDVTCTFPGNAALKDIDLSFNIDRLWEGAEPVEPHGKSSLTHSANGDDLSAHLAHNACKAFEIVPMKEGKP